MRRRFAWHCPAGPGCRRRYQATSIRGAASRDSEPCRSLPPGAGAQLLPAGRTARLVEEDGVLVADAETPVDDDMIFALIDAGRK